MNAVAPNLFDATLRERTIREGILGEDQPAYTPLPFTAIAYPFPVEQGDGFKTVDVQAVVTRWQLTDDEREAIAAGGDLYLTTLTFGEPYQPIRPTIGEPTL